MAYTSPITAVTGATFTAAQFNTSVRDNINALWVGTAAGDIDYYSSATAKTKIAKGTTKQILTMNAGATVPEWNNIFPIGAIYTSVTSTNPTAYFGGTWTAFGAGRVAVGLDAGQTEFDTVEETGGAKTHTLITAEIPSHIHQYYKAGSATTSSDGGAQRNYGGDLTDSAATGGGGAHNNLQPYIVVYMWKRTA